MRRFVLLGVSVFSLSPAVAAAQSVISGTLLVPLHYRAIGSGAYKLGIYASLGGGTPQIFEFDTGGAGLYAAYASGDTNKSKWWGTNFAATGGDVTNTYDSGIQYQGSVVRAAVSLYSDLASVTPLVTSADLLVGQMTNIVNTNTGTALWTPDGEGTPGTPPVDSAFYGDFGMSLDYAKSGIVNLVAQLSFTNGVVPGFRVHAGGGSPYVQIGLSAAETNSPSAFYFAMNASTNAPPGASFTNSGASFYSEQIFNANMTISNAATNFTANLGVTTDTGASTTIHNAKLGGVPGELLATNDKGKIEIVPDARFWLSGTDLTGTNVEFFRFDTSGNKVDVQDDKLGNELFYLNSGISLFQEYDVIYDLGGGTIGFAAVPEPQTLVLVAASAVTLLWARRKRATRR